MHSAYDTAAVNGVDGHSLSSEASQSLSQVSDVSYLLRLDSLGAPDVPRGYVLLPPPTSPPYRLRFELLGSSPLCHNGVLQTNIPISGQAFCRDQNQSFDLCSKFAGVVSVDVPIPVAGVFGFCINWKPAQSTGNATPSRSDRQSTATYYINVEPRLPNGNQHIPLDALSVCTVVSRFMGDYPHDWYRHLTGIARRNYNMVHFTPLVERGQSNSPYSLYNQHSFDSKTFQRGEADIEDMIRTMEKQGLMGMTDVVWNHTADNSIWLEDHPEAGYNVDTAPWLESAFELDSALLKFGDDMQKYGLSIDIKNQEDLARVITGMDEYAIKPLNLWQYYVVDIPACTAECINQWKKDSIDTDVLPDVPGHDWDLTRKANFVLSQNFKGRYSILGRHGRQPDFQTCASLLKSLLGRFSEHIVNKAEEELHSIFDAINSSFYEEFDADLATIRQQVHDRIRYLRLDDDGPRLGSINQKSPFIETYFARLPRNKRTIRHDQRSLALVCNGWKWGADSLQDHAGAESRAYLRREIIVWSDCVKLRYGQSRQDNPYLWDFMAEYTRLMAKHFVAFRIDNCHSTPLNVAEYMLDQARQVRPNLGVFAELFTGSEDLDYIFVKRLGISALIREAMQAWSTEEMSRLVHMHSGRPIGSFVYEEVSREKISPESNGLPAGMLSMSLGSPQKLQKIKRIPLHALFMDCTHDNQMPAQKRDARDTLPNAALVSMCASATGSVLGYDEIYPRGVDIVLDTREYYSPSSGSEFEEGASRNGIHGLKKLLNRLHTKMALDGYEETFLDHQGEYITIHRIHPHTRKGFFLAAHTAYPGYGQGYGRVAPVHLDGSLAKCLGCWQLMVNDSESARNVVSKDTQMLRGLPSQVADLASPSIKQDGVSVTINFPDDFPPGSIAVFETWTPSLDAIDNIDEIVTTGAAQAVSQLDFVDLNFLMYRCHAEEQDSSEGESGVYDVPGHGPLVYCGLQGWQSILKQIVQDNDLGHPLCQHLRSGHWALDYITRRLEAIAQKERRPNLRGIISWLDHSFEKIKQLPSFLLPRYFALTVQTAYDAARQQAIQRFAPNFHDGDEFLQDLALTSLQMSGITRSASLYPINRVPCLAAGLPHFSSSWARCWGRDIFIALRGLYLCTGRYDDARAHIEAFASVLKHGMVPNLLADGRSPRYNARDAIWFFLQNIQDYTTMVPNGEGILKSTVKRRFLPYDDTYFDVEDSRAYSTTSTIEDIIQEALQRHASGLHFREARAGINLDMQMKSEGFNIDVHVDWETGFIFGGNQYNCGTWMDKMGESEKAGSKGTPGTPRDGAAVELTGLLYSTLVWLDRLHSQGKYKYDVVKCTESGSTITFRTWAQKIQSNFERCYYVPASPNDDTHHDIQPFLVNRRGIYKDLYRSGKDYEDYQLRPNFPIAMVVAPALFDPAHAVTAIRQADSILRGPTGMATLDPSDLNYRPFYNNSEDSSDFATSKGRNYHQGPEWLWPTGFFLRAMLKFEMMQQETQEQKEAILQAVAAKLEGCRHAIKESPWAGLTELTNKNGEFCHDSSPTQAWSSSCLIDLFWDVQHL